MSIMYMYISYYPLCSTVCTVDSLYIKFAIFHFCMEINRIFFFKYECVLHAAIDSNCLQIKIEMDNPHARVFHSSIISSINIPLFSV